MEELEITETEAKGLPATVLALQVVDSTTYTTMAQAVLLLRRARKFFEGRAEPRIKEAWQHHKNLVADLKKDIEPLDKAQAYGDEQLSRYDQEQERKAKVEQAIIEAEAKARYDEEKLQMAELAEKAGDAELANTILESENTDPTPVVQKDVSTVADLWYRNDWFGDIENPALIPPRFHRLERNPKGEWSCKCIQDISAEIKRLKDTAKIPGVRVFMKKTPIGRG